MTIVDPVPPPACTEQEVSYALPPKTPSDYVCGRCGAKNGKLWRLHSVIVSAQELTCMACTKALDKRELDSFIEEIERDLPLSGGQLGGRICAVPSEDNTTYWGFTSVPTDAVAWWVALPDQGEVPAEEEPPKPVAEECQECGETIVLEPGEGCPYCEDNAAMDDWDGES